MYETRLAELNQEFNNLLEQYAGLVVALYNGRQYTDAIGKEIDKLLSDPSTDFSIVSLKQQEVIDERKSIEKEYDLKVRLDLVKFNNSLTRVVYERPDGTIFST
jgi:phosphomannomutase